MNSQATIARWLRGCTQQQRALILGGAVIFIIWLWFMLWESSYHTNYASTLEQTQKFDTQITEAAQKNDAMKKILVNPVLHQKREQLRKELAGVNAQLHAFSTQLVSSSDMVKALQTILAEDPGLTLSELRNNANFIITPPGAGKLNVEKFYQHDFILTFDGNYFSTLNYLKKMEGLPWQFYWDNIDYTVTKYPNAKITLKLHTISHDEGLLDA